MTMDSDFAAIAAMTFEPVKLDLSTLPKNGEELERLITFRAAARMVGFTVEQLTDAVRDEPEAMEELMEAAHGLAEAYRARADVLDAAHARIMIAMHRMVAEDEATSESLGGTVPALAG